jgi:hypothetical protein
LLLSTAAAEPMEEEWTTKCWVVWGLMELGLLLLLPGSPLLFKIVPIGWEEDESKIVLLFVRFNFDKLLLAN